MNLERQLKKPISNQKASFFVDSDNLEENVKYIQDKNIDSVTLIPNDEGYRLGDINFLQEIPHIKELHMGACNKVDNFEGLKYLGDLNLLVFSSGKKNKVDLSSLGQLETLSFSYSNEISGLDKLSNLVTLKVSDGTDDFFEENMFRNYLNLKSLVISKSIINSGLSFLKHNNWIEELEFNNMKRSFSIDGILELRDSLRRLKFISSKKITSIELVSELENLEWLIFSQSVKLENAEIVSSLKKLEAFTMFGSSTFVDGNLTTLKTLRDSIKNYRVQDKKHYYYE